MKNTKNNLRENLSIEFCQGLIYRLSETQSKQTRLNTIIAIKNLILHSGISDQIIFAPLIDLLADSDDDIKNLACKVLKDVNNKEITDLLKLKQNETDEKTKVLINKLLSNTL